MASYILVKVGLVVKWWVFYGCSRWWHPGVHINTNITFIPVSVLIQEITLTPCLRIKGGGCFKLLDPEKNVYDVS